MFESAREMQSRTRMGEINSTRPCALLVVAVLAGLAAVSCSSQRRSAAVGTAETTGAAIVPNSTAIQYVSATRCNREHVCNEIGPGKRFDTVEDCVRESWSSTRTELRADQCPSGVFESALDKCLYDLGTVTCRTPLANLERVPTCSKNLLCP